MRPHTQRRRVGHPFIYCWLLLEGEFGSELHASWAAAAKERIANADVASGCEGIVALIMPVGSGAVDGRIGDEIRQIRIGKIRMVEQVIGFEAQLHIQALGKTGVFEE